MTDHAELRADVLAFVRQEPGATTTAVRRAMDVRSTAVTDALEALEEAGEIENRGNGRAHAWHPTGRSGNEVFTWSSEASERLPEAVGGIRVAAWTAPRWTAELLDTSPRTLARWERKGLPAFGQGSRKRHPWPHARIWATEYESEKQRTTRRQSRLEIEVALARDRVYQLEEYGECGHPAAARS